ncbi:MAG: hypothetical protein OEZ06_12750 [Myxococcales bacterium]|nr:hypothetical protein [Myxococcales bacterium]
MTTTTPGRLLLLACACSGLLSVAVPLWAQASCGRAGKPWVSVAFAGDAWTPETRAAVLTDLGAELALQGLEACGLGNRGSQAPLALLELRSEQADRVRVLIDVHDAITEKRLARDVSLAEVAEDGRALAVAVAADELLRASWVELTLRDAPAPAREPPPEVERTLERSLRPRRDAAGFGQRLGARMAVEYHGGGQTWIGGDGLLSMLFGERAGVELRVGIREGLRADGDNGSVESSALVGGMALAWALWPRGNDFQLNATLGGHAASVQLSGRADGAAMGKEGAAFAAAAVIGLSAGLLVIAPLELRLDLGAGLPLRAVEALDGGRAVSSTAGLMLAGGLGLGVRL